MRLDKYLSLASVGTRKKVREYIYQGDVCVNGSVILEPAYQLEEADEVEYQGVKLTGVQKVCYLFYKPAGCITARSDAHDRTVFDFFTDIDRSGLFPVGRLDKDTEGLLLITNDGDLNHQLMYPEHHMKKTYFFWAYGALEEEAQERLRQGIDISEHRQGIDISEHRQPGECVMTRPAKLEIIKQGFYTELEEEMRAAGCRAIKKNLYRQEVVSGYLTISEGMKHQVKRMLKAAGCYVVYLKRVSIGGLTLDESMEKGTYRQLTEGELEQVFR